MSVSTMSPSEISTMLPVLVDAGLSAFIHGPTGIGKSNVVEQYCDANDLQLSVLPAAQLDPVDARGIPVPVPQTKTTSWYPPDFLPREGKGALFLDELNRANQDTQSALYQLILEGRIGDYLLPEGWFIMAAGNRDIDGCMVQPMSRALKNRFTHLEMESNYDDWHKWGNKKGLAEQVLAFMRWRPEALDEVKAAAKDETGKAMEVINAANAFGTPRSWEFVSRGVKAGFARGMKIKDLYHMIEGNVGEGCATEFVSYCDIYMELPDIDLMLINPDLFQPTTDPNKLYALCVGLAARANALNFDGVCAILKKMPPEYSMWTMDDCLDRNKDEISKHPAYIDWIHENIAFAG
jgi:hypothetical protein